jgi:hypothetical protein
MKRFCFCTVLALCTGDGITDMVSPEMGQESYIFAASKRDFKTAIGFINGLTIDRGITCRRWFTDKIAVQIAIGENANRGLSIDITGIRSYKRFTFARFIGYSNIVYDAGNPEYVLFGLGGGLEYYIGNLGQTITYGVLANRFEIQLGAGFGMCFRF